MRILTLTPEAYAKAKQAGRGMWFMSDDRSQVKCGALSAERMRRAFGSHVLEDVACDSRHNRTMTEKNEDNEKD
jgi:hypothetical protein